MFSKCQRPGSGFKKNGNFNFLVLMSVISLYSVALADEVEQTTSFLAVKPNKCISLHKGQLCYQKLKFSWEALPPGSYCLYQRKILEALFCWDSTDTKVYRYEFVGQDSAVFQIRAKGSDQVLAEAKLSVASVYRKGKKSAAGWRLF